MTLSKMQTSTIENVDATNGALQQARSLVPPSRDETLKRAPSVQRYWDINHLLLENAWHEWDEQNEQLAEWVTENLISEPLRNAVTLAWEDPAKEQAVANLWEEVLHGVYQAQLFDVEKLHLLRAYLDGVADAGIPLRPPYGIALYRNGGMLDASSERVLGCTYISSVF